MSAASPPGDAAVLRTSIPAPASPPAGPGPDTAAVIVHWGPVGPTIDLVERLVGMDQITRVAVVANDRQERPGELPAGVSWLVPPANLGFGGGFRHACAVLPAAEVYLLLNNDIRLEPATVDACLDLLSHPGVGIVGPTLVNADGLHPGLARLTPVFTVPRRRRNPTGAADDVSSVTGAIMFIRAECHHEVPMARRYFLYYEDLDVCFRARAAGWRVMVSPAQAWHTGGGSVPSDGYTYYAVRNRLWFARVHGRRPQVVLAAAWLMGTVIPRLAVSALLRRRGAVRIRFALHGLVDGLGRLPGPEQNLPDEPRAARWGPWGHESRRVPHPRETPRRPVARR